MLSNMESKPERPTAAQASAALTDAEASRATLAHGIATPSWLFTSMGAAIAMQIATTAVGLGYGAPLILAAGLAVFVAVAGVQLARFRRLNGVWLGGFASRVVLGSGTAASAAYAIALGAAIWAAYDARWWLVTLCVGRRRRRVRTQRPPVDARLPRAARGPRARGIGGVAGRAHRHGYRGPGALADHRLMADLDPNVVAPARLKLMTALTAVSQAEFWTVRDTLQVSDSVLSKHVAALEGVDYVKRRKGVHRGRRTTWISLTPRGREALGAHVAALRELIDGAG